jgi:hypothetical protein
MSPRAPFLASCLLGCLASATALVARQSFAALQRRGPSATPLARCSPCRMGGGTDRESEDRKAAILAQFSRAEGIKEPEAGVENAASDDASGWLQKELDLLSKGEGEVVEFMKEFVSCSWPLLSGRPKRGYAGASLRIYLSEGPKCGHAGSRSACTL